jgi:hypothetical protein
MEHVDPTYYTDLRSEIANPLVKVIPYSVYDAVWYSNRMSVPLKSLQIIKPSGGGALVDWPWKGKKIPEQERGKIFIPNYPNERGPHGDKLKEAITDAAEEYYMGNYAGPPDLAGMKAIAFLPYAISTFALFEYVAMGIPIILPSRRFLWHMIREAWVAGAVPLLGESLVTTNYTYEFPARKTVWDQLNLLVEAMSDWMYYHTRSCVVYESWEELTEILVGMEDEDWERMSVRGKKAHKKHAKETLGLWRDYLFEPEGLITIVPELQRSITDYDSMRRKEADE